MTKITYIPGEIANAAIDEHGNRKPVTRTQHIFDDVKNKNQANINVETDNTLTLHQSEINALDSQNYLTYKAESDQTLAQILPATGAVDTIYRVGNWDGSQYDVTKYSEYAWDANNNEYKLMDVKSPGIDSYPIEGSGNIAESSGVFLNNVLNGGDFEVTRHIARESSSSNYCNVTVRVKPKTLYKVTIPRVEGWNTALDFKVHDGQDNTAGVVSKIEFPIEDTDLFFYTYVYGTSGYLTFRFHVRYDDDINLKFEQCNYLLHTDGKGDLARVYYAKGKHDGTKISISELSLADCTAGRYRYKFIGENVRRFRFVTYSSSGPYQDPNINGEGIIDLTSDWIEDATGVRAYISDANEEAEFTLYLYKVANDVSLEDVAERALYLKQDSLQPVTSNSVLKISPIVTIPITTIAGTYVNTNIAISPNRIYKMSFPKVPYTSTSKTYKAYMTLYDESTNDYCAYIRIQDEDKDQYHTYICAETENIILRVYADTLQNITVRFDAIECFDFNGNIPFKSFTPYSKSDTISSKINYNRGFQSLTSGKHFFKIFNSDILRQIRPIAGTRMYPALVYDENGEGVINITEEMISGSENEQVTSIRFYYKDKTTPIDFTAALIIFNGEVEEGETKSNIFKLYSSEAFDSRIQTLKKKTPFGDNATHTPIVLLWFSDLHGNLNTFNGMTAWYNKYKDYIDDTINCGDTVTDNLSQYDSVMKDYFENVSGIPHKLIIGNHDVIGPTPSYKYWAALGNYSIKDIYDMFTGRLDLSECVQPTGISTYGYNFYYKDYDNGSTRLRLIFLDTAITKDAIDYYVEHKSNEDPDPDSTLVAATEAYETAQKQWLSDVLSDAITEQIPVAIATHCPPSSKDFNMGNSFASYGGTTHYPSKYGALSDDYLDIVQNDFIDNNGEFICWLYGHTHQDRIGLTIKHSQLQIGINTANTRRSNVSSFNPLRLENTETQYAFNHIAFDTRLKRITLLRVGCNYDLYGRKKDILVVDYNEKKPFDEVFALSDNNE